MTKEELEQYRHLGAELERLEDTIARLKEEIESPKRQLLTGMPHGGNPVTMEDKVAKLIDIQNLYNRQWDKLIELRRQIETAIQYYTISQEETQKIAHKCFKCGKITVYKNGYDGITCQYCGGQTYAAGYAKLVKED